MLSKNKYLLTITVFLFSVTLVFSQETQTFRRCGNHLVNHSYDPSLPRTTSALRLSQTINRSQKSNLPTIVHIIYTNPGFSIGTGNNLSYDQIASQFQATNNDLNKKNKNRAQTLEEFQFDATALNVEIKRALYDPQGNVLQEEGINRMYKDPGSKGYFSTGEIEDIIEQNIWDPNRYVNIWVTALPSNYLGYAFFPNILTLSGLDEVNSSEIATTSKDGVVIDYRYFGSELVDDFGLKRPYHMGRTLTHELGHYLGILHPWGVGSASSDCSKSDYCEDTPAIKGTHSDTNTTSYCDQSTEFHTKYLCDTVNYSSSMYQNFMDYTNDSCMTLFTNDQKSRVDTVLVASTARKTINQNAPNAKVTMDVDDIISNTEDGINKIVWKVPDEGTREITGYVIERSLEDKGFTYCSPILDPSTRSYTDYLPSSEDAEKKVSYRVFAVNKDGFSLESNVINIDNGVVGLKPNSPRTFSIYPNPSNGIFHLAIGDFISHVGLIEVISSTGQVVKTFDLSQHQEVVDIDLGNLPRGTYFVRLNSDFGVFNQRVIKQ
ncbi:T9SS type A sorting domain-containing protein [Flammeovirga sp. MY04]|uniref:T9SS type A sorting domain-containing protein n=1 Tax=Flammeovirga sp. MY04 TaxID=1191459 RepID=UPI000806167A|nr:T9SS type A sorting domain-containing protein [Flammeovirga sp. MY04]ANQ49688.1 T9SS type A sorting domain-containing protein [Flammeovirga sp. MY04]